MLAGIYGEFKNYRDCVEELVAELENARLFDARVESAKETAERARVLFEF